MSLSPHSIRRFAGLFGSTNPFSTSGMFGISREGAMSVADNCVIRSSDVLEPRRGFKASASCNAPVNALAFKQGVAIGITYDNPGSGIVGTLRKYDPAADAWTTLPMNPGGLPIDRPGGVVGVDTRFVSAQKALYFQSRYGLTKIEDITTGVCRAAIQPKNWTTVIGVGVVGTAISATGLSGWLTGGNQVAYRITMARFGANGELIESEPSERIIVPYNSIPANSTTVSINLMYGWMFPPDAFFRIWRSRQSLIGVDPSDELSLVVESPFNGSAPIDSAGFATKNTGTGGFVLPSIIDATPDTSLFVPLYTNPNTGGTLAIENTPAPTSVDLAWFRNRLYCLNTNDVQRITIKIIGTGSGGIQSGDSVTIAGHKIPFKSLGFAGAFEASIYTSGTVSQNLENTARSLISVANRLFSVDSSASAGGNLYTGIVATYLSTGSVDAGQIVIQSVVPGAIAFSINSSSVNGWDRDYTAGTNSSPNQQTAGLAWSNSGEPEGLPLANTTQIGDPSAAGQRIIALKEALFIFKGDGLWKLADDGSSIGPLIQPLDPTLRLVAPESAVALDNFILALCEQGVVLISETGAVVNVSHQQIERELFVLMARVGSATLANLAFGVAYQPEHTYILSLPESSNATACTRQYAYSLQTQAWTSWTVPGVLCGAVNPDTGQLCFGRSDGTIWIERKNFDSSDYQDPGFTIASPTTSAVATLIFGGDLRTGATPFAVGDLVQQFQAVNALRQRVTAVSYASGANQTTVTLDAVPRYAWNQAVPLTVAKAIQCKPTFLPIYADEPLQDKEWGDAFLSFRYCDLDFLTAGFTSEKYPIPSGANPATERINNADGSAAPIALQAWAPAPWGQTTWGRQTRDVILKSTIPQDVCGYSAQLTLALTLPCAYSRFELSAIDIKIAGETSQVTR